MIKINGVKWRLLLVSPFHPALQRSDRVTVLGCCDNLTQTIYIDNTLNKFFLKKVLCHEIAHAAMFSYNVSLTCEQEEMIVDIIATYGQEIIQITNTIFNRIIKQKKAEPRN